MKELTIDDILNDEPQTRPIRIQQKQKPIDPNVVNKTQQKQPEVNIFSTFLIVLCAVFAVATVIFAFLFFNNAKKIEQAEEPEEQEQGSIQGVETESKVTQTVPDALRDKILFSNTFNIFSANKNGTQVTQLTDFQNDYKIKTFMLIDENNIGLLRCNDDKNLKICKIYISAISTKKSKILKETTPDNEIVLVDWKNKDTYIYSTYNSFSNDWNIYYVENSKTKQIANIKGYKDKRDFFIEDYEDLAFSPDGKSFLFINTLLNGFSFETKVYSIDGKQVATITNSTYPVWVDNNSILYRNYSNQKQGFLYLYDLNKEETKLISSSKLSSYNIKVLNSNVLYWENDINATAYLYNIKTNQSQKLENNAIKPIWLSEDEIIYGSANKCALIECATNFEKVTGKKISEYKTLNINTNTTAKIQIATILLQNGIVTWFNRKS